MRWGVDSQEDMSRHTVKTSSVRAVNTSVDSAVGKSAHTVIVLCVNVNTEYTTLVFFFVKLLSPYLACVFEIYTDRSSCGVPLRKKIQFHGVTKVNYNSSSNPCVYFSELEAF